ncbi:MAG: oxidoreductase [Burkholderiales bacterium]|nr:oxidoreductase [Burkholderiales bacterium]
MPVPDQDPPPVPPLAPADDECCGNGCDPCIFDLYGIEQDRYFKELRAWKERQRLRVFRACPSSASKGA